MANWIFRDEPQQIGTAEEAVRRVPNLQPQPLGRAVKPIASQTWVSCEQELQAVDIPRVDRGNGLVECITLGIGYRHEVDLLFQCLAAQRSA